MESVEADQSAVGAVNRPLRLIDDSDDTMRADLFTNNSYILHIRAMAAVLTTWLRGRSAPILEGVGEAS